MRFIYSILIITFFCYLLIAQENDPYRLSHNVEPSFQFIHLNLDPDNEDYSGNTTIDLKIKQKRSSFRLHGRDFKITKITLQQDGNNFPVKYNFQDFGLLQISADHELKTGEYKLSINFKGKINLKGEGIVKYTKDSLNYIYTQMQDIYARQFFPCFDEPGFKFPYQVEITAPKDYLVVSNTPEEKIAETDLSKTVLFRKTKPMPSYLIAFAVGPYETVDIPDLSIPGRIILPKGYAHTSRYIKSITAKILNSLQEYFGSPYPYEKLDFLSAANYNFGAMENPGLVVFLENYLIDADELSLSQKYIAAYDVAHELAHMWFGDLVTLKWWNDTWLNEGFASWLGDEVVLKVLPELNSMDALYRNFTSSVSNDISETTTPIVRIILGNEKPWDAFDVLSYSKSQVVLRMLEKWMGEQEFRRGLQEYFRKYKWSNTAAEDLYASLESFSDKPVKQMLTDFTQQPGVPLVSCQVTGNKITLAQERLKTVEVEQDYTAKWLIPLNVKISDGEKVYQKQVVLDKSSKEFEFDDIKNIEWLHLKDVVTGYYLMLLPADIIKKALLSGQLSATETQDIFIGWQYGWQAGKVNPLDVLDLAYEFRNTKNKDIINGIAGRISDIKHIFTQTLPISLFDSYMKNTAEPMLVKIGLEVNKSFTRTERWSQGALINTLDTDSLTMNNVASIAREYLKTHTLSFDYFTHLRALFYFYGNDDLYAFVQKKIETTKNPDERLFLIIAMSYFPQRYVAKNLELVLNGDLDSKDRMLMLVHISLMYDYEKCINKQSLQPNLVEWIKENEAFFAETVSEDMYNFFLPFVINNRDDLNAFNRLFPEEQRPKTMQIEFHKEASKVRRNEKLNELYADDVKNYLENFNKKISSTF